MSTIAKPACDEYPVCANLKVDPPVSTEAGGGGMQQVQEEGQDG